MIERTATGTILRMQGGFYFVQIDDSVLQCTLPGKHKRGLHTVFPGDQAEVRVQNDSCVIHRVLPRENVIARPGIANLTQLFIVASVVEPPPDFLLLDRLLCIARYNAIKPFLLFTKCDIPTDAEDHKETIKAYYHDLSDPLFFLGEHTADDLPLVREHLADHITALAGNSGVGKSTFVNRLTGETTAPVDAVSEKLSRGRHTTRTVTLFSFADGLIADTPGFNVLTLPPDISKTDLARLYPDYLPLISQCKFSNCLHHHEPNCAIRERAEAGVLSPARYQNYLKLLQEIQSDNP